VLRRLPDVPEIRIDALTGHRTIIAPERAARGGVGTVFTVPPTAPVDPEGDPFAEGHEDRTPPEIQATGPDDRAPDTPGWGVRVVPNLHPLLTADAAQPAPFAKPDLFTALPATGAHEVVVNAPEPVMSLAELPVDRVVAAVDVWRERMRAHEAAAYVHVSVNERPEAGASREHTHAQVIALDAVPALVARERERSGAYATRTMGGNLLGDLLQEEVRMRERIVAIDDEAVLLSPFAARSPYALMLVPRTPRPRFDDEGPTGAALLHDGLQRLARRFGAPPPLTLWVRTAPRGAEHFCWHIDVVPRLTPIGGVELGTGIDVNVVAPEAAAAELRDA
jgi:UDPglucose--hexose-1-phosphate uridylyltransferase